MSGTEDDVFGPVVLAAEPLTVQPGEDPARIREIQDRLRTETKAHQTAVAKRQFNR